MKKKLRTLASLFVVISLFVSCGAENTIKSISYKEEIATTLENFCDTITAGYQEQALSYCGGKLKKDYGYLLSLRPIMPANVAANANKMYGGVFTIEKIEKLEKYPNVAIVVGYYRKDLIASFILQKGLMGNWKLMLFEDGDLLSIKSIITKDVLYDYEIYVTSVF